MKFTTILISVIAAIIASYLTVTMIQSAPNPLPQAAKQQESAFDRVLRTGKLRCAYFIVPPNFDKDTNTGEFSGLFYDITEKMGKLLDIDIEWTEEVGLGSMFEGLKSGRYDSVCTGIWENAPRSKVVDFTSPIYYPAIYAYSRKGDNRFMEDISKINSPNVKAGVSDGMMSQFIAKEDFPEAVAYSLPNMSSMADIFMLITTGKAHIAFSEKAYAQTFMENNPESVQLANPNPVRVFGSSYALPKGEHDLLNLLNATIRTMHNMGFIDRTIKKHEKYPGSFLQATRPYEVIK